MAETIEMKEEPAGPSVATAEQQPTSRVTTLEELLQRVSSLLDEDNLRRLCNFYDYCTENRSFATALELFQFLEEGNLWGCGTEQEKAEVLIERMRKLGRHDIVGIIQTFNHQENTVAVRNVVPLSLIRVKIDELFGQWQLQVNKSGKYVVLIKGNVFILTTAMYQMFGALPLLAIGGSVTVVGYALYKLGYNAVSFSWGSIEIDITTEPDKERTVRRRLENGTFLQELREEVKDIIEEHYDILGHLKDFTIISCEEILPTKEKEGDDEVKNVEVKDLSPVPQGIVQGVGEILPNKEKEGYDEVKNVGIKDLPPVPQGVNIVHGVREILPNKEKEGYEELKKVGMKNLPPVSQVDVRGEVPLSTIRVNLETFGLPSREFNKRGKVDIYLEVYKYAINAALSRQFKTEEEASIGFAIEQLGCIADELSSECCITFDITIDSDKEHTVCDILKSWTFRDELKKEVKDMIEEPPLWLFHHLHFNTISSEKIYTKAEKGKYISQVAEGRIEALVKETRQLRMLMLSLKEKFDGVDETKQSSKDQEICSDTEKRIYIIQTAEGKIEALVKETRQLRMLMLSLNNKFDGMVETMQTSKDQEPDTKTAQPFDDQTRAETVKVTTGPEPPSTDF